LRIKIGETMGVTGECKIETKMSDLEIFSVKQRDAKLRRAVIWGVWNRRCK
jgi:hypothetical protein